MLREEGVHGESLGIITTAATATTNVATVRRSIIYFVFIPLFRMIMTIALWPRLWHKEPSLAPFSALFWRKLLNAHLWFTCVIIAAGERCIVKEFLLLQRQKGYFALTVKVISQDPRGIATMANFMMLLTIGGPRRLVLQIVLHRSTPTLIWCLCRWKWHRCYNTVTPGRSCFYFCWWGWYDGSDGMLNHRITRCTIRTCLEIFVQELAHFN